MATIPRTLARRSLDVAGAINVPTGSPVGAALEQGGAKLSAVAQNLMDRQDRNDRFNAILGFDELKANLDGDFDKALTEAKPDGAGLHDTVREGQEKRFQEFLATQPEGVRPELESRWRAQSARESVRAARAELGINQQFQIKGIDERTQTASNELMKTPEALEQWKRDVDERIEASNLRPDQKLAAREKVKEALTVAAFRGLSPKDKMDVKAGWGMGQATVGEREKTAVEFFKGKGLSEHAAAAFVGRLSHESVGMRTDARNPGDGSDGSDSIGLGQWNAERAAELRAFAKQREKPVTDFQTQLEFAWHELSTKERAALEKLQSAKNAEEAGRAALEYERPRGWKSGGAYRNEDVAGWRDQMARTNALLGGKGGAPVPEDPRFKDIPPQQRIMLAGLAEREENEQKVAQAKARTAEIIGQKNQLQLRLMDGQAGLEEIQQAQDEGLLTDADEVGKFRNIVAQRNKGQDDEKRFAQAISQPGYVWNAHGKDDRDAANAGYRQLAASPEGDVISPGQAQLQAVERIVEQTNIIPPDAALALRGAMVSPNSQVMQGGLEIAAKLMRDRANIFAGVDGGGEIEQKATLFNHLLQRGFSPAKATEEVIKRDAPEFKQKVTARLKDDDVNKFVKNNIKEGDLRDAFDDSWLSGDPKLGMTTSMAREALAQYEEAAREAFLITGDEGEAKAQAIKEIKKTWGVSRINGDATIMRFPPEISPAYRGVKPENFATLYADQLAADVKARNGDEFDRSTLKLTPTERTIDQMARGEPPEYMVTYTDKNNGTIETVTRPFVADPEKMRQDQISVLQGRYDARMTAQEAVTARRSRTQEIQQRLAEEARQRIEATREAAGEPRTATAPNATVVPEEDRRVEVERDATGRATKARVGTRRLNIIRDEKGRLLRMEEEE